MLKLTETQKNALPNLKNYIKELLVVIIALYIINKFLIFVHQSITK